MTEQNRFFFSQNAFNTAFKNQDTYVVYLWTSQAENPIEFYYKDLIKHIPEDRGSGTWTNVEITV